MQNILNRSPRLKVKKTCLDIEIELAKFKHRTRRSLINGCTTITAPHMILIKNLNILFQNQEEFVK